jgi:hypothetical protein
MAYSHCIRAKAQKWLEMIYLKTEKRIMPNGMPKNLDLGQYHVPVPVLLLGIRHSNVMSDAGNVQRPLSGKQ